MFTESDVLAVVTRKELLIPSLLQQTHQRLVISSKSWKKPSKLSHLNCFQWSIQVEEVEVEAAEAVMAEVKEMEADLG